MMAHDSSAGRPQLSEESVSALTAALKRYFEGESDHAAIQPALARIAAEARRERVQAEQLLVLLKDIWYGLPGMRDSSPETQAQMLQRIVTLCIREYYS